MTTPLTKCCAALLLSFNLACVLAYAEVSPSDYFKITREPALANALAILTQIEGETTMQSLQAHQAHIIFQDLKGFGPKYAGDDALTLVNDKTHQQVIYMSNRHEHAPYQALAALIHHESMHSDNTNSIQEELCAWTAEAQTWEAMQTTFPELKNIPTKDSPLIDRLNAIVILLNTNKLAAHIKQNPGYQGLPKVSPGFESCVLN